MLACTFFNISLQTVKTNGDTKFCYLFPKCQYVTLKWHFNRIFPKSRHKLSSDGSSPLSMLGLIVRKLRCLLYTAVAVEQTSEEWNLLNFAACILLVWQNYISVEPSVGAVEVPVFQVFFNCKPQLLFVGKMILSRHSVLIALTEKSPNDTTKHLVFYPCRLNYWTGNSVWADNLPLYGNLLTGIRRIYKRNGG